MDQIQIQIITTKEGLKAALVDVLNELNIVKSPDNESKPVMRPPATRQQACAFLNISLPTLDRLVASGQIPVFNIGRQIRINWDDLEVYIKA